jgi:hypothetical protein
VRRWCTGVGVRARAEMAVGMLKLYTPLEVKAICA